MDVVDLLAAVARDEAVPDAGAHAAHDVRAPDGAAVGDAAVDAGHLEAGDEHVALATKRHMKLSAALRTVVLHGILDDKL